MTEASVSFAGNLTDAPEIRFTDSGIARAMFRVAVSGRSEQEASFFTVIVWRDQAEHASQSLSKGSRVVVVGRLQKWTWTAKYGSVPIDLGGRGRGAGAKPELGDGDCQDDGEQGSRSQLDATGTRGCDGAAAPWPTAAKQVTRPDPVRNREAPPPSRS